MALAGLEMKTLGSRLFDHGIPDAVGHMFDGITIRT